MTEQDTPNDYILVDSQASDSIRYLDICVMMGTTYNATYSSPSTEARSRFRYAEIPFNATWSIGFNNSYVNITSLPIDSCALSRTTLCTDQQCGSDCNNEIYDIIHHKNSIKNLNLIRSYISDDGYDIMITLVATPMCGVWDSHASGILGVTYLNDNYTLLSNCSSISTNVRVRIIQHEMCHMFNCNDGVCSSNYDCIMNGGYDGVSLYTENIWCRSCYDDFNPDAH